jgi:hypothetical protein
MIFEGVQYRLWFYLEHLNYVKMAAFHFYLQLRKQKKFGRWVLESCCFS